MTYTGFDIQYLIPNLFITFFYDSWVAFFSVKDGVGGYAVVQKETDQVTSIIRYCLLCDIAIHNGQMS